MTTSLGCFVGPGGSASEIGRDPGCPETVIAELSGDAGRGLIFDAVAGTPSSLKRDRRFADSPLEGARCELLVPLSALNGFDPEDRPTS